MGGRGSSFEARKSSHLRMTMAFADRRTSSTGRREARPTQLREAIHFAAVPMVRWIASRSLSSRAGFAPTRSLAMTWWELRFNFKQQIHVRLLAARLPEVCLSFSLERGSRECRMRAAPAVSCAKLYKKGAHEHTGQRRTSDIPCAMALRLISRSPRSIGLFSPPSPADNWLVRARSGRRAFRRLDADH